MGLLSGLQSYFRELPCFLACKGGFIFLDVRVGGCKRDNGRDRSQTSKQVGERLPGSERSPQPPPYILPLSPRSLAGPWGDLQPSVPLRHIKARGEAGVIPGPLLGNGSPAPIKAWHLKGNRLSDGPGERDPRWEGPQASRKSFQHWGGLCCSLKGTLHCAPGNSLSDSTTVMEKTEAAEEKLQLQKMSVQIPGVIIPHCSSPCYPGQLKRMAHLRLEIDADVNKEFVKAQKAGWGGFY